MMLHGVLKVIQYSVLKLCGGGWGENMSHWLGGTFNIGRHSFVYSANIC